MTGPRDQAWWGSERLALVAVLVLCACARSQVRDPLEACLEKIASNHSRMNIYDINLRVKWCHERYDR